MQRRFSFAFVVVTAVIALTFGTLAGGVAGGFAALMLDPDSPAVESVADVVDNPSPDPEPSPTPRPAEPEETEEVERPDEPAEEGEPVFVEERQSTIADIVEEVSPAVVTVVNEQRIGDDLLGDEEEMFPEDPERAGVGTGFIIDAEGYIITNYHVVDGSDQIAVIFADEAEVEATLIGGDQFADVAVLKIDGPVPGIVPLGDSEALRPGEQVVAIGSALGDYTNTVTEGIISALGRNLQIQAGFSMENMIQHSASINPGNSGGPLLNLQGEVVGVNTAVVRSAGLGMTVEGLGFAIPSNTAKELADQLIDDGGLERPYVGIVYEPLTQRDLRSDEAADWPIDDGVIVRQIEPDTPAAEAGIEEGDIIIGINGQTIDDENPLINELFKYQVGDTIEVEVYRPSAGERLTLELTLAVRPN